MSIIFVLLPIIAGIGISMQQSINGTLGKRIGALESAFVSFITGAVFLTIAVIFFGQGNILSIFDVPFIYLLAAVFGILFLSIMPFVVPKIGVTNAMLLVIIGQLLGGMVIDHYGFFGSDIVEIDFRRIIGLVLLTLSLLFVFFGDRLKGILEKDNFSK